MKQNKHVRTLARINTYNIFEHKVFGELKM